MPTTLVLTDQNPALSDELFTIARALGPFDVIGVDVDVEACARAGARSVHRIVHDHAHWPAVVAAGAVEAARAGGADLVLMATSPLAGEIAGRVSVALGVGVVTDVDTVGLDLTLTKVVLAGTWSTTVELVDGKGVVSVRPHQVEATPASSPSAPEVFDLAPVTDLVPVRYERTIAPAGGRPDLASAEIVVVAGRGIDGDVEPVSALADVLGAALGATRVVVDEGWMAHDLQVGQTGVTIAPRLYIGVGVSGQVHHHGGMQASMTVVAINADPDAPIFEYADYGVVGDVAQVVPQLTAELGRLR
jgi:electron transfer flavoprotein alpha subunit